MKIAIMGAGISGLTCARILEQNGLQADIFEKRDTVGDRFVNAEIFLNLLSKPVQNSLSHLSENYGIDIRPVANIRQFIISSENETAKISGQLGFTNIRGRHESSLENQLAEKIKSPIILNSKKTYEALLNEYTHIVMATGDAAYAEKITSFKRDFTAVIRGATITGKFDRYVTRVWLNQSFAPQGYAYLIPYSETEAHIAISYPGYPKNMEKSIDQQWENFLITVENSLGFEVTPTEEFAVQDYIVGAAGHPRVGNTLLTGNCFGTIMPFLGFGQETSIMTGIFAAYDLCGLGEYEKLTAPLRRSYNRSLTLRRAMEQLDNKGYDRITRVLQSKWAERIWDSRLDSLKMLSRLVKPVIAIKGASDKV